MNEEQFLHKVRAELDASEQSLDAATLSRLNQARHKALALRTKRSWTIWLPAAVTASLVAALFGGNLWLQQPNLNDDQQFAFEDIELLSSEADLDLLLDMDMLVAVADDAG